MPLPFVTGYDARDSVFTMEPDKIRIVANGAIAVGKAVMLDCTSDSISKVIQLTTAADHAFFGIYEGVGGSGALASISGLTGRAAVAGDLVEITVRGPAKVLAYDSGSNAPAAYDPASFAVTAGIATKAAALAAGICARVTFREAQAGNDAGGATTDVFINY